MKIRLFIFLMLLLFQNALAQKKWTLISTFSDGVDPYFLNENYGFAAFSASGTILRTTNGGKTWTTITTNFGGGTYGIVQIYFESPSHIFLSANPINTIFESFDSGITWKTIHSPNTAGIYAYNGTLYSSRGYYSLDDGITWITDIPGILDAGQTIVGNKENGIACFSSGGPGQYDVGGTVYSLDGGNSWALGQRKDECWSGYAIPYTQTYFRSSEATNLGDPDKNLSTEDSNVVLRTTDGGATWNKAFPNFPPPCRLTGGISGSGCAVYVQGKYNAPPIDNILVNGVWQSKDLGVTWDTIGGPGNIRDTRISCVARGAVCYAGSRSFELWKFVDSSLLRKATWDLSLKRTSASISHDTLFVTMCDSAQLTLEYGFASCDYVKLNGISIEGIPSSDYRVDFTKDKVIMQGRLDTSNIMFIPSSPGIYPITIRTYVMRDDWITEDTSFKLTLVVKPNPPVLIYSPHDTITYEAQSLCANHAVYDTINVSNKGCEKLSISSIKLETDPGSKNDFSFANILNLIVSNSDSLHSFPLSYYPKTSGNKSGRIIISSNAGIDTIYLKGVVNDNGVLSANIPSLNFDSVSTCFSSTKSAYLVNNNCDSLLITEFSSLSHPAFTQISPSLPYELHSGDSLLITITYTPKSPGFLSDSIIFSGKNPLGKFEFLTLIISGIGEKGGGVLSYYPKAFNFNSLSICAHDSASGYFTNIGCDTLRIDPIETLGNSDFHSVLSTPYSLLASGDTEFYTVYVNPAAKGIRSGMLVLSSHGAKSEKDSIPFTCAVHDGTKILSSSASSLNFGSIPVCDTKDTSFKLINTGCDTIWVSGVRFQGSGFGSNSQFPIIILPGHDTSIDIFTILDTAGGKTSSSAMLTFASDADTISPIKPINLLRTYSASVGKNIGFYLDPTPKTGGDQSSVLYAIKQIPNSDFSGNGVQSLGFTLTYNTDLLIFDPGNSKNLTSTDGKTFTLSPVSADANDVLASAAFTVFLTTDSTTNIDLSYQSDTMQIPCGILTLSGGGSANFDYQFLCGERSIQGFMNGVLPMKIVSIYPNPSQNEIIVDLNSVNAQDAGMEIYDALGARVYSDTKNIVSGQNSIRLDTKNLSPGIYQLRVGSVSQSFVKVK